ncbi:MAG: hypothetical protein LBE91_02580 [Tannerella sp.]|jgi:hypothetical protein|nr:hypothetical protein [Tannerella sp.]
MEIIIKTVKNKRDKCLFTVACGKKRTADLYYSEMIGLVSALTMPEERPTQLLLTEQQIHEIDKYLKK